MMNNTTTITIDIPEEVLFQLMILAHERDITLNQLVQDILREHIAKIEPNNDTPADHLNCW